MARDYVSMLGSPSGGLIGNLMRGKGQAREQQIASAKLDVERARVQLQAQSLGLQRAQMALEKAKITNATREAELDRELTRELKEEERQVKREGLATDIAEAEMRFAGTMEGVAQRERASKRGLAGDVLSAGARIEAAKIRTQAPSKRRPSPKAHEVSAAVFQGIRRYLNISGFDISEQKGGGGKIRNRENLDVTSATANKIATIVNAFEKDHWMKIHEGMIPESVGFDSAAMSEQATDMVIDYLMSNEATPEGPAIEVDKRGRHRINNRRVMQALQNLDLTD